MTLAQLIAARLAEIDAIKAINASAATEKRELTKEESATITAHLDKADQFKKEIEVIKSKEALQARIAGASVDMETIEPALVALDDALPAPIVTDQKMLVEDDPGRGFKTFGEVLRAVHAAGPGEIARDDRMKVLAAATGMNQAVGSEGGFTVPPLHSTMIWNGLQSDPVNLMNRATGFTIDNGESLTIPANGETSRVNGSRWGGVTGEWLQEAAQMTNSNPTLRQIKLEPNELGVLVPVTNKLLRNSTTALESYVNTAATEEIVFKVGDAMLNGTGAGQPLGILTAAHRVSVAKETSQAADTFLQTNVAKMYARLHPRAKANSIWLINSDVQPQIDEMVTPVKNVAGTENVGGFSAGLYNADKNTLKGREVLEVEWAQTIGDLGDVILSDLSMYLMAFKGTIETAMSIHLRFDFNETAFRFIFEVDGKPALQSALTPFNGTNTQSSDVVLAVRA